MQQLRQKSLQQLSSFESGHGGIVYQHNYIPLDCRDINRHRPKTSIVYKTTLRSERLLSSQTLDTSYESTWE